ncbi:23S rRNA (uracil(1939)-C(5))-methyltransferase RlmD [Christensenellaceae bacterium OttesenSCG-928-K19]|nr:23S rRNA (uracil(1939)-C(5))-methyltransferase RlmD [Christensenellaceae bacterium OttesenSCG-928-K19]
MEKNDSITIAIDDIGKDGQGIGRHNGMAVFVSGALPGEQVRTKIIKCKKNYAIGRLEEILSPSPMRVKPPCNVFKRCGGCTLQHLAYAAQLEYKQNHVKSCLERIGKLADIPVLFPLPSPQEYHYRNKAAFPVKMQNGQISIGLFSAHSHDVVDVDDCKLQHPDLAIVLSQLRVWLAKYNISIYNEETHDGLLRHVILRTAKSGEIMLVLVVNGEDIPHLSELQTLLRFVLPQVKHIILNHNLEDTNVIMGARCTTVMGRGYFLEQICGLEFKIGPTSFLQVNPQQTELLYKNLFRKLELKPTDTVLDLFCGTGTITLCAAKRVKKAYGVELSDEAIANANFNAQLNGIENAEFFAGDATALAPQILELAGHADAIIADPPRKGLSEPLIQAIVGAGPKRIGYVSCDPATLARDLALFASHGYHAGEVQPVDMFPQTTHVECLTVMYKK